jgi:hypothetical protein
VEEVVVPAQLAQEIQPAVWTFNARVHTSSSLAAWRAVASNEFVLWQFLWTGVDYLG